jgi:GxxExxY protein
VLLGSLFRLCSPRGARAPGAPSATAHRRREVGDFFADLIIDDKVIVELKAVEYLLAVHTAQVLSYLRSTRLRLALLVNFNVPVLVRGVKRLVQ